ncbi:hypothetical protein EBR96_08180 [bacterium]|nr:hypothetical protein [bacterium]
MNATIIGLLVIAGLIVLDIALLVYRVRLGMRLREESRRTFELEQQKVEAEMEKNFKSLYAGRKEVVDSIDQIQKQLDQLDAEFKS